MLRHGPRTGVLAASVSALIATGGVSFPAFGQDEEETDEAANAAADDAIIVTGTRIRRDDFTATNATVVVTAEDMRNLGVTSVADMVNQLPANVASVTPETSGDTAFGLGASIVNLRGLNTNYGTRTLVLVDSNRFVASNSNGTVDMNMIPTALVGRIETVTGGASATYGADAMAGVVNVIIDNNIEGIRVDLSYGTYDAGDGDDVNLSLGTGFELFDRRGRVTVGYDHAVQDGIANCTSREYCQRGMGILNQAPTPFTPGTPLPADAPFPNQPQYILTEGMRFTRLPTGVTPVTATPSVPGSYGTQANPIGTYTFSDDGTQIIPYLDNLPAQQRLYVSQFGLGNTGVSPWGGGPLQYEGIPLLPETERDNLFTRFLYDFEGGIELNASLTYGETTSVALQNSPRQTTISTANCMFPTNAFLQPQSGASPELIALMTARRINTAPSQPTNMGGSGACRPGPYLGNKSSDNTLPVAQQLYDYPETGGTSVPAKHFAEQIDRRNETNTQTINFNLGATGDLFEGGSWIWDASVNFGETERRQNIKDWSSARRMEMAIHSVWDPTANGGQGGAVCAIDSNQPYVAPAGPGPGHVAAYYTTPTGFNTMGEYWSARWVEYIKRSINGGEDLPPNQDLAWTYFNNLAGRDGGGAPCAPLNPLGLAASPESLAFAFPTIEQRNDISEDSISLLFSGDLGEGVGAGPFRMAAGLDFRIEETLNYANPNAYTARDFSNPLGPANANFGFADNWIGYEETQEAFVEFDFPIIRDMPAADSLAFNVGYRKTENTTERLQGAQQIVTESSDRDIDSWKASAVWRPIDMMTVRITRSADTRAPSQEELFQSNSSALSTGAQNEWANFMRINNPATTALNEQLDFQYTLGDGSNSQLGEETSTTQTVGLVFTPTELLSGLSISIDYYETHIKGGIQTITWLSTDDFCGQELLANGFNINDTQYCPNIVFDEPDPTQDVLLIPGVTITQAALDTWNLYAATQLLPGDPNPFLPYSNIDTIGGSAQNAAPYLSRGLDLSVSYNTQLSSGGAINARVIASRSLEQNLNTASGYAAFFNNTGGAPFNTGLLLDVSGQTGSSGLGSIWGSNSSSFLQYTPTPRISGNMFVTYAKNAFTFTGQIRYIGTGRLNNQQQWIGPGEQGFNVNGRYNYAPGLRGTITDSTTPSWTTLNLNFSYDFSSSRFSFDNFEELQAYITIDNAANKTPDFFSGTGPGGVNATYFSGLGRQYRLGVRMQF